MEKVLQYFDKNAIEEGKGGSSSSMASSGRDFFTPKFLTNKKLFDIQTRDSYFRRHILIQYLFFFQCLQLFSANSDIPPPNKGNRIVLTESQVCSPHVHLSVKFISLVRTIG